MKRSIMLIFALTLVLLTACSKGDDNNNVSNPPAGNWKVSYFWDEKDETSDFVGFSFVFVDGGSVTATKGGVNYTGTWSETSSKFILNFGTDPVLSELNDDWQKIEKTATSIKLKDDNPLQDDELHLTKL